MYDPHKLVQFLFSEGGMTMNPQLVQKFWQIKRHEEKEAWAVASPASDSHIPIALYGDAAQVYLHRVVKMVGIFVSFPLWRCYSNRCSRFCIFAIEEAKCWKTDTLDAIWRRVVYSLNLLFLGVHPEHGGHLVSGGLKFTLTEFRGDWLFFRQVFAWTSTWTSPTNVCFRCSARGSFQGNGSDVFYNCWDDRPNWQERDLLQFIVTQLAQRPSPCFLVCMHLILGLDVQRALFVSGNYWQNKISLLSKTCSNQSGVFRNLYRAPKVLLYSFMAGTHKCCKYARCMYAIWA